MTLGAKVWTTFLWTAVVTQSIWALETQYPELNTTVTLDCECKSSACQAVFWYWQPKDRPAQFLFLFHHTITDRVNYQSSVDQNKYKWSTKTGMRPIFSLKIVTVQKSDAGLYLCQAHGNHNLTSSPGIELLPGESPPTPPPPPPPPKTPPPCRCRNRGINKNPQGCGRLVLWPLVGVLASLAVMLIITLFYFSRLPKKCRHRFAKRKQLH
ncbi:hypothetical protein GJAV_G00027590 [Gymnothorax javanicus]|nr:hypothetical protein GJAV_G00027590 [Gymnothorax javanicus]